MSYLYIRLKIKKNMKKERKNKGWSFNTRQTQFRAAKVRITDPRKSLEKVAFTLVA